MNEYQAYFNKPFHIKVGNHLSFTASFTNSYCDGKWITTCTLQTQDNKVLSGSAVCNPHDYHKPMIGLKLAYRRAAESLIVPFYSYLETGSNDKKKAIEVALKALRTARFLAMEGKLDPKQHDRAILLSVFGQEGGAAMEKMS